MVGNAKLLTLAKIFKSYDDKVPIPENSALCVPFSFYFKMAQ